MKISELSGAALDWAVAKCEGAYVPSVETDIDGMKRVNYGGMYPEWSTDWAQGGPIIEREKIDVMWGGDRWCAYTMTPDKELQLQTEGATPLTAAMRGYIASKLGDEVDIPKELKNAE